MKGKEPPLKEIDPPLILESNGRDGGVNVFAELAKLEKKKFFIWYKGSMPQVRPFNP